MLQGSEASWQRHRSLLRVSPIRDTGEQRQTYLQRLSNNVAFGRIIVKSDARLPGTGRVALFIAVHQEETPKPVKAPIATEMMEAVPENFIIGPNRAKSNAYDDEDLLLLCP